MEYTRIGKFGEYETQRFCLADREVYAASCVPLEEYLHSLGRKVEGKFTLNVTYSVPKDSKALSGAAYSRPIAVITDGQVLAINPIKIGEVDTEEYNIQGATYTAWVARNESSDVFNLESPLSIEELKDRITPNLPEGTLVGYKRSDYYYIKPKTQVE